MPLPLPASPLVLPTFEQDRGTILFDSTTKSTQQKVTSFYANDVCDQVAYRVMGTAVSINQLSADCRTVLAGSASLSVRMPALGTEADIDTLVIPLVNALKAYLAANPI